ncbi:MAG TPA: ATP-binding protein [Candidatus Acidoferrales bacterium]|nr:ATP-binding protein [Candidatus Acidoferrales bacterium]
MRKPWTNRLLVKFFLPYIGLTLLVLAGCYFYAGKLLKQFYIASLGREMVEEARLVARFLPADLAGAALDARCKELAAELKARLTVVDLDGKVLGDSEESSARMENHAARPEIVEARAQGTGESIRYSTTVNYPMLYKAVLVASPAPARIVRVAVPLDQVEASARRIQAVLLAGLLAAFCLSMPFGFFLFERLARRVRLMAEFSQAVAQGSFPSQPLAVSGRDELGILEKNLNEMKAALQEKISSITAEKEKVESIVRCMMEGVVVLDTHGRVILINQNARRMFDLPDGPSFHGASMLEISRHPEMKQLAGEILTCDCARECFSKEMTLDSGKWLRVNAVSLTSGSGALLGYVMVFHDVTEIKRLETIRADFVANVSHELRTPLAAIKGYVETLLHNPPRAPEAAREFLEVVDRHAERLGRLIGDLLTLSDLESGKAQLNFEPLNVDHLLRRVLEIFHDHAKKKGIRLSQRVDPDVPPISGDSDRLQQLLINLVDNALKYTPPDGDVQVSARRADPVNGADAPTVEIAVSDTGCGIAEKDIPRLTERFYRVDKARSRELGGTGLGLAIVKHIVQAHQGSLRIESALKRGTTVRICLPAARPARPFQKLLFLCAANSCRSQMAEGFARHLAPPEVAVFSAGTHPTAVHPLAVEVMQEVGIDISGQQSKGIDDVPLETADLIVTLCGEAAASCPAAGAKAEHLHWPLPDPALAEGSEEQILQRFREVRDEIRARVETLMRADLPGRRPPSPLA